MVQDLSDQNSFAVISKLILIVGNNKCSHLTPSQDYHVHATGNHFNDISSTWLNCSFCSKYYAPDMPSLLLHQVRTPSDVSNILCFSRMLLPCVQVWMGFYSELQIFLLLMGLKRWIGIYTWFKILKTSFGFSVDAKFHSADILRQ